MQSGVHVARFVPLVGDAMTFRTSVILCVSMVALAVIATLIIGYVLEHSDSPIITPAGRPGRDLPNPVK
jgi:hypothetical protein